MACLWSGSECNPEVVTRQVQQVYSTETQRAMQGARGSVKPSLVKC